jgi:hypothetical protein
MVIARSLPMPSNIKLLWKCVAVKINLAYCATEIITVVKYFTVQALRVS